MRWVRACVHVMGGGCCCVCVEERDELSSSRGVGSGGVGSGGVEVCMMCVCGVYSVCVCV